MNALSNLEEAEKPIRDAVTLEGVAVEANKRACAASSNGFVTVMCVEPVAHSVTCIRQT